MSKITEKIDKYLNEKEGTDQERLKKGFGDAKLTVVYSYNDKNDAWLVIGKHQPTNKYYGINYMDEVIQGVSKAKVTSWAKEFTKKPVKLSEGCKNKKKLLTEEGDKYKCKCGWVYDPAKTGREFSEEPNDFKCPKCGAGKSAFTKM